MGEIRIGTSGWVYPSWRAHLYQGIPVKRWLSHAASTFDTLEINGSFYTQIKPETYARWRDQTPAGFRFSLKGHRFVTHYKRLLDVDRSVDLLRDQAASLGDKLAAVIWQLPQTMPVALDRLDRFMAALARWPGVRHVFEARHRSWFTDEVAARLADAGVANCLSDAPDFPMWRAITTDLVYVRLHGHTRKYASSYHTTHLRRWAADALAWAAEGRDVLVYLDNDAEGAAVANARKLRELVEVRAAPRARTPRRSAC
jgi:uncharacterized protein YecE (DUF72 family)